MKTLYLALLVGTAIGTARAQAPASDVILRTDGTELPGRVLTITPLEVRYLPPAGADTLRLAAAEVFLVRYANGTRELLHPAPQAPAAAPGLLDGLSNSQRRSLATRAAHQNYTDQGAFWGSLACSLYPGPLLGVAAPAIFSACKVKPARLNAPHPELLTDPAYGAAYRREAQRRKRGRAWGGYATGLGVWVVLIGVFVAGSH